METKFCNKCGNDKPVDDFAWKNKNLQKRASNCKACQKIMKDCHYQENREAYIKKAARHRAAYAEWWKEFKATLSCEECGEDHPATIDFHHVRDKEITLANAIHQGWGKKRVMEEVAKCKVLCANCHRKEHWHT